jgi:hypothetical protein
MIGLVEGIGDKISLPHLFAKAGKTSAISLIELGGKTNIVRQNDGWEKTIARQIELGQSDFFILLDADVYFFPYSTYTEELNGMKDRVAYFLSKRKNIKIRLFWATKNYESWLIGGLRKGDRFCELTSFKAIPGDTQAHPENTKEWLKAHISDGRYGPDVQRCLTKHIDLGLARQRNNSLKVFLDAL